MKLEKVLCRALVVLKVLGQRSQSRLVSFPYRATLSICSGSYMIQEPVRQITSAAPDSDDPAPPSPAPDKAPFPIFADPAAAPPPAPITTDEAHCPRAPSPTPPLPRTNPPTSAPLAIRVATRPLADKPISPRPNTAF